MAPAPEIGWYPNDPNFRKRFEEAVRDGLRHFERYGDITQVQRLLEPISDTSTRYLIAKSVSDQFPVLLGRNGKLARDKTRADGFDWSIIESARFWPKRIQISGDRFFILGEEFSSGELIDEVIDALVLHRNAIPDDELQRLKNAVDAVAKLRASNLTGDTQESGCSEE